MAMYGAAAPFIPTPPAGWSIGPDGSWIDPQGGTHAPGTGATPAASDLPLASMAVVGAVGYYLGKPRGEANLWAGVGAALGYFFKPIG